MVSKVFYYVTKSFAKSAKHAKEMGFDGPLHECSIYGSKTAGEKIISTMALGESQPWQDTFENLTGSRQLSGKSILNYYAPLKDWLDDQNKQRTCGWK